MKLITPLLTTVALLLPLGLAQAQPGRTDPYGDSTIERAREAERERERRERARERREDREDDERSRVTYSSIGLSRLSTDFDNVEEAVSLDAGLGFRIPDVQWFAVQLDLGFTIIPGEVSAGSCGGLFGSPCPDNITRGRDDFRAINIGVFGIIRTPGKVYAMGKLGYRYINTNLPELDDDRSGRAYGGGVGYRYSKSGGFAELQYTKLSDELDAVGFALGYGFGGD